MDYILLVAGLLLASAVAALLIVGAFRILKKNPFVDRRIIIAVSVLFFLINFVGIIYGLNEKYSGADLLFEYYYAALRSFFNVAKVFVFSDNYSSMTGLGSNGVFKVIYYSVSLACYIVYALTLLMLLSWKTATKIKMLFSRPSKLYLFTELNEQSFALAKDIKTNAQKNGERVMILFIPPFFSKTDMQSQLYKRALSEKFLLTERGTDPKNYISAKIDGVSYRQIYLYSGQNNLLERLRIPKKLYANKKVRIFAFGKDEKDNISFVINEHHTFYIKNSEAQVKFYVRTDNPCDLFAFNRNKYAKIDDMPRATYDMNRTVDGKSNTVDGKSKVVEGKSNMVIVDDKITYNDVSVICPSDIAGEHFIDVCEVYRCVPRERINDVGQADYDFKVSQFGLGQTGESIFRNIYTDVQGKGVRFTADFYDKNIGANRDYYENKYKYLLDDGALELNCFNADNIYSINPEKLAESDYIVIALGDDQLNYKTANAAVRLLAAQKIKCGLTKKIHIAVCLKDKDNEIFLCEGNDYVETFSFGSVGEIFNEKIIVKEEITQKAKILNYFYDKIYDNKDLINKINGGEDYNAQLEQYVEQIARDPDLKREAAEKWEKLAPLEKLSSVSSATHIKAKKYYAKFNQADGVSFGQKIKSNAELYDNISQAEHMRWNAFYYTNGWTNMPYNGKTKDKLAKKHVCLVKWEQLDALSKQVGVNYKLLDKLFVEIIDKCDANI